MNNNYGTFSGTFTVRLDLSYTVIFHSHPHFKHHHSIVLTPVHEQSQLPPPPDRTFAAYYAALSLLHADVRM